MIRALIAATLLLAAAPAADDQTRALVEGKMPEDPARPLVQGKCMLCHSAEYVTQQRLTETQWQKTVDKMRKFGTPASDEEAKLMAAYLARYWTTELPAPRAVRVPAPRGSVPAR